MAGTAKDAGDAAVESVGKKGVLMGKECDFCKGQKNSPGVGPGGLLGLGHST